MAPPVVANDDPNHGHAYLARILGEAAFGASGTSSFPGERYRRRFFRSGLDAPGGGRAVYEALPSVISQVSKEWSLTVGKPYQPGGHTAWFAPARDGLGRLLALKVAWWHPEASHEAAGLRAGPSGQAH